MVLPHPGAPLLRRAPADARERLLRIATPFKAAEWRAALEEAGGLTEFGDIPINIASGFPLGLEHVTIARTHIQRNHFSSESDRAFVVSKYAEEIALGRMSKGYDPATLEKLIGPFRTVPLGVAETRPGKQRVIVDHSFPRNPTLDTPITTPCAVDPALVSNNAIIDTSQFLCAWGSFSECYLLVADAPAGTEAAVFDVESAFRNVPTHPASRNFTCYSVADGLVNVDFCGNFGASSMPGIWGHIADAMALILRHHGVDALIKWVDDFVFFRYPVGGSSPLSFVYHYDASLVWAVADRLGWPWAPAKFMDFASSFRYIGFDWDIGRRRVSLPIEKKAKYLGRLASWVSGATISLLDAEKVIGTLNHVTLVAPHGRAYMPGLYGFRAAFGARASPFTRHRLTASAVECVIWWRALLLRDDVGIDIVRPPAPTPDVLYVDASTGWGIGLVLNGRWLAWEFKAGWKSDGRDIGWAEMVAVELATRTLAAGGWQGKHVILHSDNQGVVGALAAGRSRGTQQNQILRRIVDLFHSSGIWVTTKWVPTKENPADAPSRGAFASRESLLTHPPAIPRHLLPYIHPHVARCDPRL